MLAKLCDVCTHMERESMVECHGLFCSGLPECSSLASETISRMSKYLMRANTGPLRLPYLTKKHTCDQPVRAGWKMKRIVFFQLLHGAVNTLPAETAFITYAQEDTIRGGRISSRCSQLS